MYLHTKNEVSSLLGQGFQKLEHEQDRQTDATERITSHICLKRQGNKVPSGGRNVLLHVMAHSVV